MNYKLFLLSPYQEDYSSLSKALDKDIDINYFYNAQQCLDSLSFLSTPFILVLSSKIEDIYYETFLSECNQLTVIHNIIIYSSYGSIKDISSSIDNGAYNFITGDNCFEQINESINLIEEQNTIINNNNSSMTYDHSILFNILNQLKDISANFHSESIYAKYKQWETEQQHLYSTPKVLIVEDEEIYLSFLHDLIVKDIPKHIFTESSGLKAMEIITKEKPNVVLLDLFLSDSDGTEVLKHIKKVSPFTQVIIITAFDLLDTACSVLKMGIFDYIRKPVLKQQLLSRLNKALLSYQTLFIKKTAIESFFSSILHYDEKLTLLESLIKEKAAINKPVFVEDLFIFFPELKDRKIPRQITFPKTVKRQNLDSFISLILNKKNTTETFSS